MTAHADVAVPTPGGSWVRQCADKLDDAARRVGLRAGARVVEYPLRHEQGTLNRVDYVEWASDGFSVLAGKDADDHADAPWKMNQMHRYTDELGDRTFKTWFRRASHHFGKIEGQFSELASREFKVALDECLKMGDPK
jgi:hypothetical protein